MIKFRHLNIGFSFVLPLCSIVTRIQFTCAADESSSSSTRISQDSDSMFTDAEIWQDVNHAIDKFIDVYQSQKEGTLIVDRKLKPTNEFEAGPGLLCATFRLEFTFHGQGDDYDREQRSSVIVKVPQLTGSRYLKGERMFFYDKEKFMYERVFPLMFESWPFEKLTPELHLVTEKSRILFLENLHESGFHTTGNALFDSAGMCKQVMESLAQFHALASVSLKKDNDLFRNLFERTNRSVNCALDLELVSLQKEKFEEYVMPSLTSRVKDKIAYIYKNLSSVFMSGQQASFIGFNVILHGDPNRSNVFFTSGEFRSEWETAGGCKFIDFYLSRMGSPVIDLMNYVLSSVQFEVFKADEQTLFGSYVHEFSRTVPKGYRKYDLRQLYRDLRSYKLYFVYILIFAIPGYWRNTESVVVDDEKDLYEKVYSSEKYQLFFKNWIEYLMEI